MQEDIKHTILLFGSARAKSHADWQKQLDKQKAALASELKGIEKTIEMRRRKIKRQLP